MAFPWFIWPKSDAAIFLCAFGLTVGIDLPTAVGASLSQVVSEAGMADSVTG